MTADDVPEVNGGQQQALPVRVARFQYKIFALGFKNRMQLQGFLTREIKGESK